MTNKLIILLIIYLFFTMFTMLGVWIITSVIWLVTNNMMDRDTFLVISFGGPLTLTILTVTYNFILKFFKKDL